ncbi:hypothetical protein ISCGN_002501 [Ixodes scapularis]
MVTSRQNEWITEFIHITELARRPSWEAAFREAYVCLPSKTQQCRIIGRRVQQKGEHHETYALNLEETKAEIITGLALSELSYAIRNRSHLSINDLLRDISSYERFQKNRDARFLSDRTQQGERGHGKLRKPSCRHELRMTIPTIPRIRGRNVSIVRNLATLHEIARIHNGRKCVLAVGSKDTVQITVMSEKENALQVVKDKDRHKVCGSSQVFKSVNIDGEPTAALLDTGAHIGLIKTKLAAQLVKQSSSS